MSEIERAVDAVQEVVAEVSPAPVEFNKMTSATDVKARLDWGEPALTIIDIRDRESYNDRRIAGAIPGASEEELKRVRESLEAERDIYVYGNSDDDGKRVAADLEKAGFERVAVLKGGLSAWKSAGGLTEGRDTQSPKVSPEFAQKLASD